MGRTSTNSSRGFTLIELLVSLALGMLVVGTAVKLFSQGLDATFVVSQRAEMQQDLRAASNLLLKDISLAGAGMPPGQGVALPSGTAITSIYGCDQVGNCIPGGGIAYPCSTNVGPCIPTLYGVIPGWQLGIKPPGSPVNSDVITIVYTDQVFALNCYAVTFPVGGAINPVTFTAPVPTPPTCVLPPGLVNPQPSPIQSSACRRAIWFCSRTRWRQAPVRRSARCRMRGAVVASIPSISWMRTRCNSTRALPPEAI